MLVDTLGRRNRLLDDKACLQCGLLFRPKHRSSKYCSRPCAWANNGSLPQKDEIWWTDQKGYRQGRVRLADGSQRRVKAHRLVMERHLGRRLSPGEHVHHIDGNKQNNVIENLQLISPSDHSKLTNGERHYKRGYKLNLTDEERAARSERAKARHARATLLKATPEQSDV